jgi:hypothetical protein
LAKSDWKTQQCDGDEGVSRVYHAMDDAGLDSCIRRERVAATIRPWIRIIRAAKKDMIFPVGECSSASLSDIGVQGPSRT